MAMQVGLLRAVNVGGRKLAMADLKAMLEALGLGHVRTLLQTGSVVFVGAAKTGAALEAWLETETEKRLGLRTDYLVRTTAEWGAIVAANPFPREARDDPSHLLVLALKATPPAGALESLRAAVVGRETIRPGDRALYAYYPDGIGESKLTVALIERHLRTRCTGRNWNTTLKLQAALAEAAVRR